MFNINMFEDVLIKQVREKKLSHDTKEYYIACIKRLEACCSNKEGHSAGILEDALQNICEKNNQLSKYVAAIKKYERDVLGSPKLLLYGEPLVRIRSKTSASKKGKKLSNTETTYTHKINGLHDKKLKLAFRLQKQSGIRVDELANIIKNDLIFDEQNKTLQVRVSKGKRDKARIVDVINNQYLYDNLKEYVSNLTDGEKLFYSTSYLKKKAHEYGMETHDLRRINSRVRFREEVADGSSRREARSAVARQLGHDDPKVTSLYLGGEWKGGSGGNQENIKRKR